MTPERWRRIEEVFEAAAGRGAAERAAYLDAECAGDDELRREVESLLEHRQPTGSLVSTFLREGVRLLPFSPTSSRAC